MVKDLYPGSAGSKPSHLVTMNVSGAETLFFTADDGASGNELFRSDGTSAGTMIVVDLNPGQVAFLFPNSSFPSELTVIGGLLFFAATDPNDGRELFRSGGTAATTMKFDVFPGQTFGPNSSVPEELTAVGSTLYFRAIGTYAQGFELWRFDPPYFLPQSAADIFPGPMSGYPQGLTEVGGTLYFAADDGSERQRALERVADRRSRAGQRRQSRVRFFGPDAVDRRRRTPLVRS